MHVAVTKTSRSIGAEIKSNATALIPLLRERAPEIEALGKLPDDVVEAMAQAGIWKIVVPVELGGYYPLPAREIFEIVTEISKGNCSAGWATVINLTSDMARDWPEQAQREFFDLNHVGPFAGCSIFNLSHAEGVARPVEGGYMVQGSWSFSTNIRTAAWEIGGTSVVDEDGQVQDRIHVMIPRSQLKVADDWRVTGMKGSGSNTAYTDEEVFVPEYRTVKVSEIIKKAFEGGIKEVQAAASGPGAAALGGLGAGIAAIALGGAYGALEIFIAKAKTRKPWAQAYPTIADMPSTQITVAKVRTKISVCEAALRQAVDRVDREAAGEDLQLSPQEAEIDTYYESVFAVSTLRDAIADLQNVIGSSTAAEGDLLGMFARDVRVMSMHGGLRLDWWSESYGRSLLGLPPKPGMNLDSEPARRPHVKHVELIGG